MLTKPFPRLHAHPAYLWALAIAACGRKKRKKPRLRYTNVHEINQDAARVNAAAGMEWQQRTFEHGTTRWANHRTRCAKHLHPVRNKPRSIFGTLPKSKTNVPNLA